MKEYNNSAEYQEFVDEYVSKFSYGDMLYNDGYLEIDEKNKEMIKLIIFNHDYDKLLKPLVYKLYKYTSADNLLYCSLNLYDVEVIKYKLASKDPKDRMLYRLISGSYDKIDNSITYKRKKDISHELLHLASTRPSYYKTGMHSGFSYVRGKKKYNSGLNEGYTEMLDRRIFFDGNYNTSSYKKNVYFMRLIELLYENPKEMESDYFRANHRSMENHFLNYGTMDELNKLSATMDKYDFNIDNEEVKETFKLLKDIIKRTDNDDKILLSSEYEKEYYKRK